MSQHDTNSIEAREVSPSRASNPDDLAATFVKGTSEVRPTDEVRFARTAAESNRPAVSIHDVDDEVDNRTPDEVAYAERFMECLHRAADRLIAEARAERSARARAEEARRSIGKRLRFEIFKRDGFACRYCGAGREESVLHIDHVVPVSHGGLSDAENLVTACRDCNLGKSDIPLTQMALPAKDPS